VKNPSLDLARYGLKLLLQRAYPVKRYEFGIYRCQSKETPQDNAFREHLVTILLFIRTICINY
jgi:hypothetical protein